VTKKIQVIVNPASGDSEPDLDTVGKVFQEYDVEWVSSTTEQAGDARRMASQAAADGVDVVVAYGGDGTVGEVASGVVGTDASLAILPGGTANVMALELGIPNDLSEAAHIVCGRDSKLDEIDVGTVAEHHFLLRVGIGFEAEVIEVTARPQKARFGILAYLWSGLKRLRQTDIVNYRFVIDGESVESKGFLCTIANAGSLGLPGLRLGSTVSMRDGLLDVFVVEELGWQSLHEVLEEVFGGQDKAPSEQEAAMREYTADIEGMLHHWQGAEVNVTMDPRQVVQYDGEELETVKLPIACKVLRRELNVIVPV
jgi:diacylglycerol kinase (ATP)